MIRRILRGLWLSSAALIILAAVLLSIARFLTPVVNKYQPQLTNFISNTLHHPIHLSKIDAGWYWLEPVLKFSNVVVLNKAGTRSLLHVNQLQVGFNLWQSLLHWHPVTGLVLASGGNITVRQHEDGHFSIDGFTDGGLITASEQPTPKPQQYLAWLFSHEKIKLKNVDIHYVNKNHNILPISDLNLLVQNKGGHHSLRGSARLAQTISSSLHFIGNFQTDLSDQRWRGKLYLQGNDILINQWLEKPILSHIEINNGTLDFHTSISIKNNLITNAEVNLTGQHINLHSTINDANQFIKQMNASLNLKRKKHGWELKGNHMQISADGFDWPTNRFKLIFNDNKQFDFSLNYFRLNDLLPFIADGLHLGKDASRKLSLIKPNGELHNLKIHYIVANDWQVKTDFANIVTTPIAKLPGLKHLAGSLILNNKNMTVDLTSYDVVISLAEYLRRPLHFKKLKGIFNWKFSDDWQWSAKHVVAVNPDFHIDATMSWKHYQNSDDKLDLMAALTINQLAHISQYLPLNLLPVRLYRWLETAFPGKGSVTSTLVFHGDPHSFPFDKHPGVFQANLYAKDLELHYAPRWPSAKGVFAEVMFKNRGMDARILNGSIADLPLDNVHIAIPVLGREGSVHLEGSISTDFSNAAKFLRQTPLHRKFALLDDMRLSGPIGLGVDFTIPFRNLLRDLKLQGEVQLKDSTLDYPVWKTALTNMSGLLAFTQSELSGKDIKAKLFGAPTTLQIQTLHPKSNVTLSRVKLRGDLVLSKALKIFDKEFANEFEGRTKFKAQLDLDPDGKQPNKLSLYSNLRGITIKLPQPLAKKKALVRPLRIKASIANQKNSQVSVDYGQHFHAKLIYDEKKQQFNRGYVAFGKKKASLSKKDGIVVDGQLSLLSLKKWWHLLAPLTKMKGDSKFNVRLVDLGIAKLDLWGYLIEDMRILLTKQATEYSIELMSPAIIGKILIPLKKELFIQANLQKLHLTSSPPETQFKMSLKPQDIPALKIDIADLTIKQKKLGHVELKTIPAENKMIIDTLAVNNTYFDLGASGVWSYENNKMHSQLKGKFSTKNASKALEQLGYNSALRGKKGRLEFELQWDGTPYKLDLKRMNGQVQIRLYNGRILHLSPSTESKIGLSKVINILSLQNLPRRLFLDFSDFKKKGLPFKILHGDFSLTDGHATTEDLSLDGPVSFIKMNGEIDLAKKEFDMYLHVTPYVTSSLPVIATIAGGPVAGAATWVASRLVRQGMKKASLYTYKVTGPWKKPVIKQVHHRAHYRNQHTTA